MFEGAHLNQNRCLKGHILTPSESNPQMFQGTQLRILPHICLFCDNSAYATSKMCPLKSYVPPAHGGRGGHFKGPGPTPPICLKMPKCAIFGTFGESCFKHTPKVGVHRENLLIGNVIKSFFGGFYICWNYVISFSQHFPMRKFS